MKEPPARRSAAFKLYQHAKHASHGDTRLLSAVEVYLVGAENTKLHPLKTG